MHSSRDSISIQSNDIIQSLPFIETICYIQMATKYSQKCIASSSLTRLKQEKKILICSIFSPTAYSTNGLLKEFHAQWNLLLILEVQQKILAISGSRSDCCNKTILRFELYHKDKVIPFPKYLSLITQLCNTKGSHRLCDLFLMTTQKNS